MRNRDESGAVLTEYSLAIVLMVIVATAALVVVREAVRRRGEQSVEVLHTQTPVECPPLPPSACR